MTSVRPMNRRAFLLLACCAAAAAASPAHADFVESVRAQLQGQGYRQIAVSSTMLGRSRIVARSKSGTREIIMNPRTGEILRDLWSSAEGGSGPSIVGNDDQDDEKDDDKGDDGNDDGDSDGDNSGHGGGDGDSDGDGGSDGDSGGDSDGDSGGDNSGHGGGDGDNDGGGDD